MGRIISVWVQHRTKHFHEHNEHCQPNHGILQARLLIFFHLVERSISTMTETYQRKVYSEAIHNRKHHLPPSCSEKRLKYSSKAGKACGSVSGRWRNEEQCFYHLGVSTRCIFTGKKLMTPLDIEVPCFSGIFRLRYADSANHILKRGWTWTIFRARVLWLIIWRCCGVLIIQP